MNIEDIFPGMKSLPRQSVSKVEEAENEVDKTETPEEKKKRQVAERRRYFILKKKYGNK
jgi:hypothetical protein